MKHRMTTYEVFEVDDAGNELSYKKTTCIVCCSEDETQDCEERMKNKRWSEENLRKYVAWHKEHGISLHRKI